MRLWSLHPKYLDAQGLVALWREALLARAVLLNQTKGYQNHPQLERFRCHDVPDKAIESYLLMVYQEALARGYRFDKTKVTITDDSVDAIDVTTGQLAYEWQHLLRKLSLRAPMVYEKWQLTQQLDCHPLFVVKPGAIATWEKVTQIA